MACRNRRWDAGSTFDFCLGARGGNALGGRGVRRMPVRARGREGVRVEELRSCLDPRLRGDDDFLTPRTPRLRVTLPNPFPVLILDSQIDPLPTLSNGEGIKSFCPLCVLRGLCVILPIPVRDSLSPNLHH
jgi:hypothetical protein